jgi:two-component system KDP operon response regulator KdpE
MGVRSGRIGEGTVKRFRVLVADDEERILNFLRSKLKASGYDVLTASDGREALEQAQAQDPDLVVLDLVMPGMDGFETLKQLRSFTEMPVVILSARGADTDKIKGLGLGADDFLQKPFNPDELVARIEAVRRRLDPAGRRKPLESVSVEGLTIEFESRRLFVNGEERPLTRIEWLLLSELARNMGRLITYEELLTRLWGPEYRDDVQTLRTWISRLRHKLEAQPGSAGLIRTVPKTGYIMDLPSA